MPEDTINEARIAAIETALSDLMQILDETPPVGTVLMLSHDDLDQGRYLACEGQAIDITLPENAPFIRLFRKIGTTYGGEGTTFHLPDLQGEFPRFLDRQGNVDPGRRLGDRQAYRTGLPQTPFVADSAGNHNHQIDGVGDHGHPLNLETTASRIWRGGDTTYNTAAYPPVSDNKSTAGGGAHNHTLHPTGDHTHNISGGDSETAPRNVAFVGCIRY